MRGKIISFVVMMVITILLSFSSVGFGLTRQEIINIAELYENHLWLATSINVFHGEDPDGLRVETPDANCNLPNKNPGWWAISEQGVNILNTGIPYKWGGFSSITGFDSGMVNALYAGDLWTSKTRGSNCSVGVDCSGLVSRCWRLSTKYSTRSLPNISRELSSFSDLQTGDILNRPGSHVMLCAENNPGATVIVYEASSIDWNVSQREYEVSILRSRNYNPRSYFKPIDVVLVIDTSGSMSGTKLADAKNASKMFIDFMQTDDKIGVVEFNYYGLLLHPLAQIDSAGSVKSTAKYAVSSLTAGGSTCIGCGLQIGQNELVLRGTNDPVWAMVLLSDGHENRSPYVSDILPNITKTKIYTIGLGGGADQSLLSSIARQTGGSYRFAASSGDLQGIYNSIVASVYNKSTIASSSGTIQQGSTVQNTVVVDSSTSSVNFSINWEGSDIDLILIQPDGRIIDPDVASTDQDITFVNGSTYEFYKVDSPMAGEWTMVIIGISISPGGENYTISITADSAIIFSAELDKTEYLPHGDIKLTVFLEDPIVDIPDLQPILNADISVVVNDPTGNIHNLTLYDDGLHQDGTANDGFYANIFNNTAQQGNYTFRIDASGISNRGQTFTRTSIKDTIVGNDSDNDGMPDAWENIYGLDKYNDDSTGDPDNDGLTNLEEYQNRTHPKNPDTDGDGYSDGEEVQAGSDPLDPNSIPNNPPIADAGSDQTVAADSTCMANITLDGSASSDPDGDPLTYTWTWDGSSADGVNPTIQLPLGTTTITLVVNDGTLDSGPDEVEITVTDTTPPEISLTVSPDTLWPPNHKMVSIIPTITVNDNCDPNPAVKLTSITTNEGDETNTYDPEFDNTQGDGHTIDDIQVDENGNIYLRAERSGTGSGRIYTITYTATDSSGNSSTASATVTVPHDQE